MLTRDIATTYEKQALEKMRDIPKLQYDLPMPGLGSSTVNYDLQRWRERRINYLNSRLSVASYAMTREFDRER